MPILYLTIRGTFCTRHWSGVNHYLQCINLCGYNFYGVQM